MSHDQKPPEIDEAVLEEGCYHLSRLGLTREEVAEHFELTPGRVRRLAESYARKLRSGEVLSDPFDSVFWEDVKKEAEGDVKVTFVSDKGVHHAWRSEIAKLDGPSLLSIYESSKDFVSADPNQRFLDFKPPPGYDPLAMEREVKKSLEVIDALLQEKWKERRELRRTNRSRVAKRKKE
jgi:hypothetical protein